MPRVLSIDVAKGLAILMVIAFHSEIPFLAGTEMPLFFFLSGFFAPKSSKYDISTALAKRSSGLLVLFYKYLLFLSFFPIIVTCLPFFSEFRPQSFLQWISVDHLLLKPFFNTPYQPFSAPLWFISTLWFAFLLWLLTRKSIECWLQFSFVRKVKVFAILSLVLIASIRGPQIEAAPVVGWIGRILYAYCWLCFGFIFIQYKDIFLNERWGGLQAIIHFNFALPCVKVVLRSP